MRQIVLLDDSNQPSGILTRKDLMGFAVEDKLQASVHRDGSQVSFISWRSCSFSQDILARALNNTLGQLYPINPNVNIKTTTQLKDLQLLRYIFENLFFEFTET